MEQQQEQQERFGDRLAALLAHYGQNAYQMAGLMGYDRPNKLYALIRHEAKPGFETLVDMLRAYPEVRAEWLLTGAEPMLHTAAEPTPAASTVAAVVAPNPGSVVLVPAKAQDRYWQLVGTPDGLQEFETMALPGFTGEFYRAFEVEGDRLGSTVGHGDLVVGRRVQRWDLIPPSHLYVVVTEADVRPARLGGPLRTGESVELKFDNSFYGSQQLPFKEVKELWEVVARVTTNIPANASERLLGMLEAMTKDSQQLRQLVMERTGGKEVK